MVTINNRVQHGSDGFRYGPPDDHELGVQSVDEYLHFRYYQTKIPFNQMYSERFKKENIGCSEGWSYDIGAWESGHLVDEDKPDIVAEIDGKKHDKLLHKIQDGIAKKWIEETFPGCKFVRIRKEDCVYSTWIAKRLRI